MKTFTFISTLLVAGCVEGQFGGLWNGGPFNPWNNPAHPANIGLANGIAARNAFAWPAAPFIRAAPIPSAFANSPALNMGEVPSEYKTTLDDLKDRKAELDAKLQEAVMTGGVAAAKFRPAFVNDILKQRMQLVNEIRRTEQEFVRDRLAMVAKRQQIAKQIVESGEPISFGLLMRSLNMAYGQEMAAKSIAHQKEVFERFEKPFLRPVVSVFAPEGLPTGAVAETKIYQNLKEQKGTLLKDTDFYIMTKVSGFSGDKLHLGLDLHGVNETSDDAQALSEDFLETELEFQDEMLESQMELTQKMLELQLDGAEKQSDLQKKIMEKQMDRAKKILELKKKLAEKERDVQEKMAEKQQDLIEKQMEKEQERLEKELEHQQKLLEKQKDKLEKELEKRRDQLEKQLEKEHLVNLFPQDLVQRQMELNAQRVERQLEFARQQALLHNPFAQPNLDKGLEFLRSRVHAFPMNEQLLLLNQLEKAAELEEKKQEKQKDLVEKQLEKEQDLLEKQAEKEKDLAEKQAEKAKDLAEKQSEKEAKAAEKLKDQMEKENELVQKQLEKEQDLAEKQLEKEQDLREKQADLLEKQLEKDAKLAEKQLEKEAKLAEKQLEKEAKMMEKQLEAEQKQLEKEAKLAEKELEKQAKAAEKEQDKLEKQMEKEAKKAEKQLELEMDLMEKQPLILSAVALEDDGFDTFSIAPFPGMPDFSAQDQEIQAMQDEIDRLEAEQVAVMPASDDLSFRPMPFVPRRGILLP